jgi:hypothetical protein
VRTIRIQSDHSSSPDAWNLRISTASGQRAASGLTWRESDDGLNGPPLYYGMIETKQKIDSRSGRNESTAHIYIRIHSECRTSHCRTSETHVYPSVRDRPAARKVEQVDPKERARAGIVIYRRTKSQYLRHLRGRCSNTHGNREPKRLYLGTRTVHLGQR